MHSACTPNSKVYSRNLVQLSNTSMYSHTAPGTLQGSVQCPLVHSKRHEQDPQQLAQCISNSKGRLMNSFFPKTKSKIFIDCCVLCYVFSRLLIVDCCFFVLHNTSGSTICRALNFDLQLTRKKLTKAASTVNEKPLTQALHWGISCGSHEMNFQH